MHNREACHPFGRSLMIYSSRLIGLCDIFFLATALKKEEELKRKRAQRKASSQDTNWSTKVHGLQRYNDN